VHAERKAGTSETWEGVRVRLTPIADGALVSRRVRR